ncbi:MAG: AIR carboxylase family protein [Candidatus Pacebacteria bacterium]|nr:AIR carboxylase family protein [Candidatus Paceibacterota bacterium]
MDNQKDKKIIEGKTKIVWSVKGNKESVIIENKDDITAFDDSSFTKQFKSKAEYATTVTCGVFKLLKSAGIPVAYNKQLSSTEFSAPNCIMIPLEAVSRRFAVGSFLKRHPELTMKEEDNPHRFHKLVTEFFLKTTEGKMVNPEGKNLLDGPNLQKGEDDPFISNIFEDKWKIFHSKKPDWDENASLGREIEADKILPKNSKEMIENMDKTLRKVFLTLEGAWNNLGYRFIDLKIEFGIDQKGNLLVADVIDNDSWRLKDADWKELSKEAFRQGEELDEVEKKYGFVAGLSKNLRIPRQVLVLWRGSDGDSFPELGLFEKSKEIAIEEVTISGHKSPQSCLNKLEEILGRYPDGGVVIAKVGRSNGLGPILAARTSWPVIAVPATMDSSPEDIWSSVRMPSKVPLATVWPETNAILLASEILAQKNPVLYQKRQFAIERQDI